MPGVTFAAWTYNGRIPGPTLRAARASGCGSRSSTARRTRTRSTSTASTRPSRTACPGIGAGEIAPGEQHRLRVRRAAGRACTSITATSGRWPSTSPRASTARSSSTRRTAREEADEMVMVMNGFDTNFDRANEIYAANTIGFAYMDRPIMAAGELMRIYLVNVLEYDLINSFHLHGNLFNYFPTGTGRRPRRADRHGDALPGPARHPRVALPLPRQVHVPRAPVRVHRARLAGLLRGRLMGAATQSVRVPAWLLGLVPLLLIAAGSRCSRRWTARAWASGAGRRPRSWPSSGPCSRRAMIELTVRNDGPDAVRSHRSWSTTPSRSSPAPTGPIGRLETATVQVHSRGSRARPTRSR